MNLLQIKEETEIKNNDLCDYSDQYLTCASEYLEKYSCKQCDYLTDLKVYLVKHKHGLNLNKLETTQKYSCLKCHNFHSDSLLIFAKHENEKCPIEDRNETQKTESTHCYGNRGFHCNHRHYTTRHKQFFVHHLTAKRLPPEIVQWFKCDQCDFKIQTPSLQENQEICHSPENIVWLKCEFCPFKSKRERHLKKHIRVKHADPLLYHHCTQCSFKARFGSYLKEHILLRHTASEDINWFKCELCPYKSKRHSGLNQHIKAMHTEHKDITWFQCDKCIYKCKRQVNLKGHVKNKHTDPEDITWFQCDKCNFQAKRQIYLKRHVKKKHTDS